MGKGSPVNWLKVVDILSFVAWFTLLLLTTLPGNEARTVEQFLSIRLSLGNLLIFGTLLLSWHLSLLTFGNYESSPSRNAGQQAVKIVSAVAVASVTWLTFGLVFDISFLRVPFLVELSAGAVLLMFATRFVARQLLRSRTRFRPNLRRLLIIGLNPRAIRIARELEQSPERGYRVVGFADKPTVAMGCYPLVSDLEGLPGYIRQTAIDEVIVCLPLKSMYEKVVDIVDACEKQGVTVRVLADVLPVPDARSTIETFHDSALISVYPHGISTTGAQIKRLFDIVTSGVLLALLAPLFAAIAIVLKLSSSGPVMFRQERLGLSKKTFMILKFRTMVENAAEQQATLEHLNEVDGPAFKIDADPRITRIGRFLRRTSIDELPQLINVLKGEMSLVGPRPLPVRDYEGFNADWHRRRFSVRPGISGLWQVSGRSDLPFDDWMALDLQYINEWSLMLDLKVLLKTVPAVLRGTGAS